MSYDIRAMSLSEMLDTAFRLVRDHFSVLFPLSLLSYLPIGAAFALMMGYIDPATGEFAELEAEQLITIVLVWLGVLVLLSLIFPLVWTATTSCVREAYLGRPVELDGALKLGAGKYVHFVWVFTLYTLILLGLMTLVSLAMVALVTVGSISETLGGLGALGIAVAVLLGLPVIFLLAIWLYAFGFLLTVVLVTEELGAMDTIRRAWWLVNSSRGRVLGVSLVVYIITVIPSSATQMFMSFMPLVGGLIWGAVQGIAFAYSVAAFVILYYDILCREEAFDLEHLARRVEEEPPLDASPGAAIGG
jgi:hypothetical protein